MLQYKLNQRLGRSVCVYAALITSIRTKPVLHLSQYFLCRNIVFVYGECFVNFLVAFCKLIIFGCSVLANTKVLGSSLVSSCFQLKSLSTSCGGFSCYAVQFIPLKGIFSLHMPSICLCMPPGICNMIFQGELLKVGVSFQTDMTGRNLSTA